MGYVHIMDVLAFGFHERGEPMKLDEFRPLFSRLITGNCGYSSDDAAQQIDTGNADLIAFGRPFITNPDLPARIKNDWPFADFSNSEHWYSAGAKSYIDYPNYQPNT